MNFPHKAMLGFGEGYAGQDARAVEDVKPTKHYEVDTSGTKPRPSWIDYALKHETVIVPITVNEHPDLENMLKNQGLERDNEHPHELSREFYAGSDRPDVSKR